MKITFTQQTISEMEQKQSLRRQAETAGEARNAAFFAQGVYAASFQNGQTDLMPGGGSVKGKSLIELQQEAGSANVAVSQDYMTLAAHTMSKEDYAKMQEEGFDFGSMDPEEVVTIVDKIKAEMARSGQYVAGYTDDLDLTTLSEALGSVALAQAVSDSFQKADLPLTEANLAEVSNAWNLAAQLQNLSEGAREYLVDNGLAGEIWNLYLAQNSGAGRGSSGARFYAENVQGYYTRNAGSISEVNLAGAGEGGANSSLTGQIERIIEQAGMEINRDNLDNASWLLGKNLPLTAENLNRLAQLQEIQLPVTEERFAEAVADAIAAGRQGLHGDLTGGHKNIYQQAAETLAYYESDVPWAATAGDVVARRQLEEIRLRMTAEVNVKLLRSGFAIDTTPMEQLVEALRQAERQLAAQYFPGDAKALDKYEIYRDTNRVLAELPGVPADILGEFTEDRGGMPLEQFHREGVARQESYREASREYEALMTAPRADLGDSIKKAFANVDDILRDLGLETVEENRRAARILGYNRMEFTLENIERVRDADRQVQHVMERLTPGATLKMIRDGINPLEKNFRELEQYFDSLPSEFRQESESYSRFLYDLERNHQITPQERESFIGIYRLMRQIEKSDGAAVGAVVNSQAELHFSNLLSAVRSGRVKMDVRVSDELGAISQVIAGGESISAQIAKAFRRECSVATRVSQTDGAVDSYNQEQLQIMRETILAADAECVALLERGQLKPGADNLMAARALLGSKEPLFKEGDGPAEESEGAMAGREESHMGDADNVLWRQLDDKDLFTERYADRLQSELDAVEQRTFEEAEGYLDVRRMQLDHKQLTVAASLAKQEEFFLPMYVGDILAKVHLVFDKDGREKGSVDIQVFLKERTVKAHLQYKDGRIQGDLEVNGKREVMNTDIFADIIKEGGDVPGNTELYRVAKAFLQSVQQGEMMYEN